MAESNVLEKWQYKNLVCVSVLLTVYHNSQISDMTFKLNWTEEDEVCSCH